MTIVLIVFDYCLDLALTTSRNSVKSVVIKVKIYKKRCSHQKVYFEKQFIPANPLSMKHCVMLSR